MGCGIYTGIVVGGGVMGAGQGAADSTDPVSHAGAIVAHSRLKLSAICDVNASMDAKSWGVPVYGSLELALEETDPDFAVVAVPEGAQLNVLEHLLQSDVKLVVAEKPLALKVSEAEDIVSCYKESGKKLIVNMSRRFSATYSRMAEIFRSKDELPICATIYYAKGVRHNGVHGLDLVEYLFGDITSWTPLYHRIDYDASDPSVALFIQTKLCPQVFFSVLDERLVTHFEVDVFTDRRRYTVDSDHRRLSTRVILEGVGIPRGRRFSSSNYSSTDYCKSLENLMNNVVGVLDGHEDVICSGEDGIKSLKLACAILEHVRDV